MRFPDVSDTQITFVYGGDLWIMPKSGGQAMQITHSPGEESYPKFSPDGTEIAYTASYNGNSDIYVMPAKGGVPVRVTYASYSDRMVEWHPDGKRILFASKRETGIRSVSQFFLVDKNGGLPQRLSVPYGELASFSADGNKPAYITKITENYPFKRYRGGLTSDVIIYDLQTNKAENITNNLANDGKPVWVGDKIYFLSDQDKNMRLNIWVYDVAGKAAKQLTSFNDFDISYFSAGSKEIVFENGGTLFLMDLATEKYQAVKVDVVSDLSLEVSKMKNVEKSILSASAAPEGKRIVFESRGELFNAPVKEGFVMNLTKPGGWAGGDCKHCPLCVACCGAKTKFKKIDSLSRFIGNSIYKPYYDRMHARLKSNPYYTRRISKIRSKTVEPVLGTLINFLNMKKINSRGMTQANKHVLMAALTYNLKKYLNFERRIIKTGALAISKSAVDMGNTVILLIWAVFGWKRCFFFEPILSGRKS